MRENCALDGKNLTTTRHPFAEYGTLISGSGGDLEIPVSDRRLFAAFQNGLAVVAKGSRWSPQVKAALDRAFRAELDLHRIIESDSETILSLYEDLSAGEKTTSISAVERQRDLRRIISQAADERASDIHFKMLPGYCEIRIRVHGRLRPLTTRTPEDGIALINAVFAVASDQGSMAGSSSFMKGALLRSSGLLPTGVDLARLQHSPATDYRPFLAIRLKYTSQSNEDDLSKLGYLPRQLVDLQLMRRRTSGLYLLSGKVSSGKTTTLQKLLNAMIEEKSHEISIMALEEPVELDVSGAVHVSIIAHSGQTREQAFIEAVKATLRSDPNVVVIGELRDRELACRAVELAMTGHALWSTVHAGSALGILDRLSDLGVESWKLADPTIVRGLVYQRLIGLLCPKCKLSFSKAVNGNYLSQSLAKKTAQLTGRSAQQLFVRGKGCSNCRSGLIGRTVVAETLLPDPLILNYYADGDRSAMRDHWLKPKTKNGLGGIPVLHHALIKVGMGICDINEVEEEVDLISSYVRDYPLQSKSLATDVDSAIKEGK